MYITNNLLAGVMGWISSFHSPPTQVWNILQNYLIIGCRIHYLTSMFDGLFLMPLMLLIQ